MFSEMHPSPIEFSWAERPSIGVNFFDCNRSECCLVNSSAFSLRALRFGVIAEGSQLMHLSMLEVQLIIEPLRDYLRDGIPPRETPFRDVNGRDCILKASTDRLGYIELGVLTIPINQVQKRVIPNGVMSLTKQHFDELLPNINSFLAHGSSRPDLSEAWFGPRKRYENE